MYQPLSMKINKLSFKTWNLDAASYIFLLILNYTTIGMVDS